MYLGVRDCGSCLLRFLPVVVLAVYLGSHACSRYIKNPKINRMDQKIKKEIRYYYKHREEILEKRLQKRLEDPVFLEKYEERQRKSAERLALEKERALKRELRKLHATLILSGDE